MIAQSEINIGIGDKASETSFADLAGQCNGGKKKYGRITDLTEIRANFRASCLRDSLFDGVVPAYDEFLDMRRKLMAESVQPWYRSL